MNAGLPKQFIALRGTPLLMHTIAAFRAYDPAIELIVVLPPAQIDFWNALCREHNFQIAHTIIKGGDTRFDSVKNGLAAVREEGIIAVHDGVRPLVSRATLENCFATAEQRGTAIPVIPLVDSLRRVENGGSVAVDRSHYFAVQTPQVFQSAILKTAYEQTYKAQFTDDATVVESLGIEVTLVEGNRENIKITTPPDIRIAEVFLSDTVDR
jgi:2-C-methyl-D-erythritol 4-phosphate cytidylyltransferase